MKNANYFVKNVACPKCRENGEDISGDNLAQYSDGSSYCWKCHHWNNDNVDPRKLLDRHSGRLPKTLPLITLPSDACLDYPSKALVWINQYELTRTDMLQNGIVWSEQYERLIFPFWDGENLVGWQGRYFGKDSKQGKWFSRGNLNTLYYIFFLGRKVGHERHKTQVIVLVEDVISAMKVSKVGINAMPLFGVNVKSRMPQIRVLGYQEAVLWLDPDQYIKMIKECNAERLNGFKMHPILEMKDPKYFSVEEIKKLLKI